MDPSHTLFYELRKEYSIYELSQIGRRQKNFQGEAGNKKNTEKQQNDRKIALLCLFQA